MDCRGKAWILNFVRTTCQRHGYVQQPNVVQWEREYFFIRCTKCHKSWTNCDFTTMCIHLQDNYYNKVNNNVQTNRFLTWFPMYGSSPDKNGIHRVLNLEHCRKSTRNRILYQVLIVQPQLHSSLKDLITTQINKMVQSNPMNVNIY